MQICIYIYIYHTSIGLWTNLHRNVSRMLEDGNPFSGLWNGWVSLSERQMTLGALRKRLKGLLVPRWPWWNTSHLVVFRGLRGWKPMSWSMKTHENRWKPMKNVILWQLSREYHWISCDVMGMEVIEWWWLRGIHGFQGWSHGGLTGFSGIDDWLTIFIGLKCDFLICLWDSMGCVWMCTGWIMEYLSSGYTNIAMENDHV